MTAAEFHQQQLEQQEQEELQVIDTVKSMLHNHAKMIACAQTIKDSKKDPLYVEIAVKNLLEALEEYESLTRRTA